ncbi:hypothetical protein T484DRAFT_1893100, partial [Baffinella frigidus]
MTAGGASGGGEEDGEGEWEGVVVSELQRLRSMQHAQGRMLADTFQALQGAVVELRARDQSRSEEVDAIREAVTALASRIGELAGDVHGMKENEIERAFQDDSGTQAAARQRAAERENVSAQVAEAQGAVRTFEERLFLTEQSLHASFSENAALTAFSHSVLGSSQSAALGDGAAGTPGSPGGWGVFTGKPAQSLALFSSTPSHSRTGTLFSASSSSVGEGGAGATSIGVQQTSGSGGIGNPSPPTDASALLPASRAAAPALRGASPGGSGKHDEFDHSFDHLFDHSPIR